jgi:hypothetical protein
MKYPYTEDVGAIRNRKVLYKYKNRENAMHLKVIVDGIEYHGISDSTLNIQETADKWYNQISDITSLSMPLADGSVLVIGKQAVQKAHLIFCED